MNHKDSQGVALAMAVVGALLVSIMAALVLNMTYRSFYLSAFQTDHTASFYASEVGAQYVIRRIQVDRVYADPNFPGVQGFENVIRAAGASPPGPNRAYVITSLRAPQNPVIDGVAVTPDLRTDDLAVGKLGPPATRRDVTVWIRFTNGNNPPYQIRAFSDYGNLP